MDPSRSGLIRPLWEKKNPSYEDYVEWSLGAGMFLFKREGAFVKNTGQTFRDFLQRGFEGHRATLEDYRLHLTTLFPEVRLKNTLEVRSCDSLPPRLALAALAVWTGALYDDAALDLVEDFVAPFSHDQVERDRPRIIDESLAAPLLGKSGFEWAERLLEIARGGLIRRARQDGGGRDETTYLEPAEEILESRLVPAQRALQRHQASGSLIEATRIQFEH
jgi:glutamate--cysteine ligase